MIDAGQVQPLSNSQIVTEIADLVPPEDAKPRKFNPIPSMLHHLDRTNLEDYSLDDAFRTYDEDTNRVLAESETGKERFVTKLVDTSKY